MSYVYNRRDLIQLSSQFIGTLAVLKLSGCGPVSGNLSRLQAEEKYTVKDMYSHDAGSRGFKGYTLKAEDIAKGEPVTLYLTEGNPNRGGHRHAFVVGKEHFKDLIKGKKITMKTEKAAGHDHTVVIDPNYNPSNANSVEISASQFEDRPQENPIPKNHELKLAVSDSDQPVIYLSSEKDILDGSAEYCIGSNEECGSSPARWLKMELESRLNQKKLYRIKESISSSDPVILHFRANKSDGFMHRMIKLVKGQ